MLPSNIEGDCLLCTINVACHTQSRLAIAVIDCGEALRTSDAERNHRAGRQRRPGTRSCRVIVAPLTMSTTASMHGKPGGMWMQKLCKEQRAV